MRIQASLIANPASTVSHYDLTPAQLNESILLLGTQMSALEEKMRRNNSHYDPSTKAYSRIREEDLEIDEGYVSVDSSDTEYRYVSVDNTNGGDMELAIQHAHEHIEGRKLAEELCRELGIVAVREMGETLKMHSMLD